MKRKVSPLIQATVHYHCRPLKHLDDKMTEIAEEWDGTKSGSEHYEPLDLSGISFVFPTGMKRYRFIQRARKFLREVETGVGSFVLFK